MTWVIVILNVLFLFSVISAVNDAACETEEFVEACEAGTGLGVFVIVIFWAFVNMILGIIWLVTNKRGRDCPVCGSNVKKGRTVCKKCGHDFAAATAGQQHQAPPPPGPPAGPPTTPPPTA